MEEVLGIENDVHGKIVTLPDSVLLPIIAR
jgi:hypothetical protein